MSEETQYRRLFDKNPSPDEKTVLDAIGDPNVELWVRLREFLDKS